MILISNSEVSKQMTVTLSHAQERNEADHLFYTSEEGYKIRFSLDYFEENSNVYGDNECSLATRFVNLYAGYDRKDWGVVLNFPNGFTDAALTIFNHLRGERNPIMDADEGGAFFYVTLSDCTIRLGADENNTYLYICQS